MSRYSIAVLAALAGGVMCLGETWTNVPIVDTACSAKAKANPDAHSRECALGCAKGGLGIVASDGTYLKFDEGGNAKALAALQASKKVDHLRVTVEGKREGGSIHVTSLRMQGE